MVHKFKANLAQNKNCGKDWSSVPSNKKKEGRKRGREERKKGGKEGNNFIK